MHVARSVFIFGCSLIFLMPSKSCPCWSCVLVRGADCANLAVDRPNKNPLAHALGLCRSCLRCRRCDQHGSEPRIFVDDMPLHCRRKYRSVHTPNCPTLSETLPLCSVCDNLIAVPCTECLDEVELTLRRSGVVRCSSCAEYDLVVKGEHLHDKRRWKRPWEGSSFLDKVGKRGLCSLNTIVSTVYLLF